MDKDEAIKQIVEILTTKYGGRHGNGKTMFYITEDEINRVLLLIDAIKYG